EEGLGRLEEVIEQARASGTTVISGEEVFKLYDTFGFPKELTEEYVEEYGLSIDEAGFEREMEKQRTRARQSRDTASSMQVQDDVLTSIKEPSTFTGYEQHKVDTKVTHIVADRGLVDEASEGETVSVILDSTPFCAASGGQVADAGTIMTDGATARVLDVQKAPNGHHIH